ncbi:protein FAR1-RELATED SEQUENCE 2-like [Amaranthus tricolor]|uniref:protein FAR1-RELATED SEQUENCE 2-like n=1 Tax=Amaranthus tricolor TaxID=29722 RepID=UPI0025907290|nr:protein FAR1-RELATED SEQUENCE 2-like [Amaranthus tricolor]
MTLTNHNFLVALCLMRDEAAMSYSWVLQELRDIFGTTQTPSVIVTDRDEGLSAAIRDIFPDVRHFLCIWHIANDVENIVDKLCGCGGKRNQQGQVFRKSRWNPLVESSTIDEFEERWQAIVNT